MKRFKHMALFFLTLLKKKPPKHNYIHSNFPQGQFFSELSTKSQHPPPTPHPQASIFYLRESRGWGCGVCPISFPFRKTKGKQGRFSLVLLEAIKSRTHVKLCMLSFCKVSY